MRKKYKGQAGFELATFRLRKGIQQEIAASESEVAVRNLYSIPGELDTTDTHTPTPEVPRRTSLVRNLRRPWAPREHSPEREKKKITKSTHPLLAQCPSLSVAVIGARYPAQAGQAGAGGNPPGLILGCDCLQSRRGARR